MTDERDVERLAEKLEDCSLLTLSETACGFYPHIKNVRKQAYKEAARRLLETGEVRVGTISQLAGFTKRHARAATLSEVREKVKEREEQCLAKWRAAIDDEVYTEQAIYLDGYGHGCRDVLVVLDELERPATEGGDETEGLRSGTSASNGTNKHGPDVERPAEERADRHDMSSTRSPYGPKVEPATSAGSGRDVEAIVLEALEHNAQGHRRLAGYGGTPGDWWEVDRAAIEGIAEDVVAALAQPERKDGE